MINFLNNTEAYKVVDEYQVKANDSMLMTIRVIQSLINNQDAPYLAYPYFARLDRCSEPKYHGRGSTSEEALQSCLNAINGVPFLSILSPVAS